MPGPRPLLEGPPEALESVGAARLRPQAELGAGLSHRPRGIGPAPGPRGGPTMGGGVAAAPSNPLDCGPFLSP